MDKDILECFASPHPPKFSEEEDQAEEPPAKKGKGVCPAEGCTLEGGAPQLRAHCISATTEKYHYVCVP